MEQDLIEWAWDADNEDHMWSRHQTTADDVYAVCFDDEAVHTRNDPGHTADRLMLGLDRDGRLVAVPYKVLDGPGMRWRAATAFYVTSDDLRRLYWDLRDRQDRGG